MADKPAILKHMPHFLKPITPFIVDRAEGSWVYSVDGEKWLDFVMGIAVVGTGHCHPRVVAAVQEQAARVPHAQTGIYRHQPMLDLSARLARLLPDPIDEILYMNSGAEAIENAVKLAKQVTRRPGVIAFQGAFHGRTHLTMAMTDSAVHYRGHFEPLVPAVYHARYCNAFRTPASEDPTAYALEDLRRVLRAEVYPDDVACIVVEPIQGEGGFVVPTAEFMRELRSVADEIGALLILDEIQAGVGRTGTWFCFEHYGIVPDVVVIAKGIASGYPISAVAARGELWDMCLPGSMGGTYGGNAVACAAALATLDVMEDERLPQNAAEQGQKLLGYLRDKQQRYPGIGDVRGKGLMVAVELVRAGGREPDAEAAKAFIAEAAKRKVILMSAGSFGNCVRFLPALSLSDEELAFALSVFDECFVSVYG
jgi:4-aminobutyrate aminotransferase